MSLLERLRRLIASNVNALFEALGDPGSAIDELIANMESAAREARAEVKAALAEDVRTRRLRETTAKSVAEWSARAERAVKASDDNLAREALARRAELEAELSSIDADRSKAKAQLDELTHGLRELDGKIAAVKSRKETLKEVMRARARDGAADRYDKFVTNVDVAEADVSLGEELSDASVKQRIEKLQTDRDADARLAALKAKMKKP